MGFIPPNADVPPPNADGGLVNPAPNKDGLFVAPPAPNAPPPEVAGADVLPPV